MQDKLAVAAKLFILNVSGTGFVVHYVIAHAVVTG